MKIASDIFALLTLIIVVAIIAVLISPNSQTAQVIKAFASSFSEILRTAMSPVGGK